MSVPAGTPKPRLRLQVSYIGRSQWWRVIGPGWSWATGWQRTSGEAIRRVRKTVT